MRLRDLTSDPGGETGSGEKSPNPYQNIRFTVWVGSNVPFPGLLELRFPVSPGRFVLLVLPPGGTDTIGF